MPRFQPEGRTDEHDGESLAGHRDRGHRDRDLSHQRGEQGTAEHHEGSADTAAGECDQQVRELER